MFAETTSVAGVVPLAGDIDNHDELLFTLALQVSGAAVLPIDNVWLEGFGPPCVALKESEPGLTVKELTMGPGPPRMVIGTVALPPASFTTSVPEETERPSPSTQIW